MFVNSKLKAVIIKITLAPTGPGIMDMKDGVAVILKLS